MIVKCPQCGTGYSIPEHVIADKPKKMRCSRCKHIFMLTRRQDNAPAGYEEFTGAQHLPQEFAFLKEAKKEPAPEPPVEETPPAKEEAPFAVIRPSTPPQEGGSPRMPTGPVPAPPPARRSSPPAPAQVPQMEAKAEIATASTSAPVPAPEPPASARAPVPDAARHSWEEESPLELSSYALPQEPQSRGAQVFGKLVFVAIVVGIVFFVYVGYRNGWSLSLSELGNQISFAFSGKQYEEITDEARDLVVTASARKLVPAEGGAQYLIVSGEVTNRSFTGLSHIVLSGRIKNPMGETLSELRAPCGKVLDEDTIARTKKGAMSGHYLEHNGLYNCVISYKGSAPFQVVFEDVPADYEPSFEVDVKAVSAQVAE